VRRERYYHVPVPAFLFGKAPDEGVDPTPEEKVRQWCAFELIRAYGVSVARLEFEHQVKVGSKTYRIDILVKRDGIPWLVVEVKEPNHRNPSAAVGQAISYADAQGMDAEFVLYTNGSTWIVRRKVGREWVEVPDLPIKAREETERHAFGDILHALDLVCSLVCKLDDPLSDAEAECLLATLQVFFHGQNFLTIELAPELCHATDNLLRALSVRNGHIDYQWQKLGHARQHWEAYGKQIGSAHRIHEMDGAGFIDAEMGMIRYALEEMMRAAGAPRSADVLLLRLDVALLDYGQECFKRKTQFLPIPPSVHHALREIVDHLLATRLDTRLPDPIDTGSMEEVRAHCASQWEQRLADTRPR
jgi:hypothetical protein